MTTKSKFALLALAAVALAGCDKAPPGAVQATPATTTPAEAASSQERLVALNEAGQREAGLKEEKVVIRSLPQVIRANGRLTLNENSTWRVGAVTEGRIIRADAKVGDRVQAGQILARMHSHDIHEARADYQRALGEFNRFRANREFALRSRDRMKRLYDLKAASFEQLDHAENELKNAAVAMDNAQTELNRTRLHLVEFLQIPVEGPEEHGHDARPETHVEDLIPVTAPASGVIVTRNITPGAVVSASSDLFVIANLDSIWTIAAVQEESLSRVKVGMPARVFVQAYPDRAFQGKVGKIGEMLDATTRTVSVRVEIANRTGLLKPEMYATVEIEAGGSENALFLPQGATQDIGGQTSVFVRRDRDHFEIRPVELGRSLDGYVQAVRGLKPGDSVVIQGAFVLKSQLMKASMSEE